jgi:MFS family permease
MLITSRWWITKIQRKFLISFGFLIGVIAKELLGPNTAIFGISENNVVVIGFGLGMNGIAMACMALPFIPDVIETIGKSMDPQSVNNIGAALFVGGYSAGYFVGPITGGYIFDGYLNKN